MQSGLTATLEHVVAPADTATALGSGDVEVLATPRVLALLEAATVAAVAAELPAGKTSVGAHVELEHLAPTRVGAVVQATAELLSVDGRRLVFDVRLDEAGTTVARGSVTRVLVDRDRFG